MNIDLDALGKLLCLAKSLDAAFSDVPHSKAIERVLIRTKEDGHLTFQIKGGSFWRFFAITLAGREKEYDLGQNFAQLQSLFQRLVSHSEKEIRRAAQGMAMYGETVIDTGDAIATLGRLEQTLNSIIDHIKQKKLRRQQDDERKKNIAQALDAMRITFSPKNESSVGVETSTKKAAKKRDTAHSSDTCIEEALEALKAKIVAKKANPYEAAYLRGRKRALESCKKELMLWQNGACAPSQELAAFKDVKTLLQEWDASAPEISQLKQLAVESRHKFASAITCLQERLDRLASISHDTSDEKRKKYLLLLEQENENMKEEDQGQSGLGELFGRLGEHYLVQSHAFQQDIQEIGHAVLAKKSLIKKLEESIETLEKEVPDLKQPRKPASRRKK